MGILEKYLLALNTYSYFSYHGIFEHPKGLIIIYKKRSNLIFQSFIFIITLFVCVLCEPVKRLHQDKKQLIIFFSLNVLVLKENLDHINYCFSLNEINVIERPWFFCLFVFQIQVFSEILTRK